MLFSLFGCNNTTATGSFYKGFMFYTYINWKDTACSLPYSRNNLFRKSSKQTLLQVMQAKAKRLKEQELWIIGLCFSHRYS